MKNFIITEDLVYEVVKAVLDSLDEGYAGKWVSKDEYWKQIAKYKKFLNKGSTDYDHYPEK